MIFIETHDTPEDVTTGFTGKLQTSSSVWRETPSLTFREEFRLRVIENRILWIIFVYKGDENKDWRRLYNEELHSLYRSTNIVRMIKSRRLRWAGNLARMEQEKDF